jgi:hypothetical protein
MVVRVAVFAWLAYASLFGLVNLVADLPESAVSVAFTVVSFLALATGLLHERLGQLLNSLRHRGEATPQPPTDG